MSEKNLQLSELPDLISLTEVRRETGQTPGRIIRRCSKVWVDFVPVEEGYHWLGHRLMAHRRDRLVSIDGIYPLTEDSQRTIASRTMSPSQSMGFALVRDLAVETKTGILVVCSLSKGTCPPIPTPRILVPEEVLEEFLEDYAEPYETAPEVSPEKRGRKVLKDGLDELLLEIMKSGVNSGERVYRIIVREMNSKQRNFDKQGILLQKLGNRERGFRWKKGGLEQKCTIKTLRNRISDIRRHFPEL